MLFEGTNLKKVVGAAVRGRPKQDSARARRCADIVGRSSSTQTDIQNLEREVSRLENEIRRNNRKTIDAGVDNAEGLISIIVPMLGRARKAFKLIVAVRRAMRGQAGRRIVDELFDLIDIVGDVADGISGIRDLARLIPEWSELNQQVGRVEAAQRRARRSAERLAQDYQANRCNEINRRPDDATPQEGRQPFVGV